MPEPCPAASVLIAWSEGTASGDPTPERIGQHVARCPRCAGFLESRTRSLLATLDLARLREGPESEDPASSAVVNRLIETALSGFPVSASAGDPLPDFLAALTPPAEPGSLGRFAGYEVEELTGRGGMGAVFRAFDPTLQRRVALKVLLHEDSATDPDDTTSRCLREARAVAALRHEHVVEVYAAGRDHGWSYLVMPFHPEGTLQQWIDQGNAPTLDTVLRLAVQLLRALEIAHAQGILHRDLKPSNVLLERGLAHVRLADFGLAQPVGESAARRSGTVAGTPRYMAPEQARGEPLDARCDVYGLGAILHHLLFGHPPPAEAPDGRAPTRPAPGEQPPQTGLSTGVPPRIRRALDRCLAPDPAGRYPDARAAREAFEALARASERRPDRRRALRWLGGAVGFVAAALFGLAALEIAGRTSVLNPLLCWWTGDGFFIRGRIGTHADLARAVGACREGDTVVARFNGELPVAPVRIESSGLHVQAAPGFRPMLTATNAGEPLFLALGPLVLEGLTLVGLGETRDSGQLIAAEGTAITLVHCRLLRLRPSGDDLLVRAGRRLDPEQPLLIYKPLVTLRSGSSLDLRHSLILGLGATAIGLRSVGPEPIRIETDQCLFTIHRTFALRPESSTRVVIHNRNSVFAAAAMLDIENAAALGQLTVTWDRCVLDATGGTLLRWTRGGDASWLSRMTWTETNVVYAGSGDFAFERRRGPVNTEAEWNALVGLSASDHRIIPRPLFGEIRARSTRRLEPPDLDLAGLAADSRLPIGFRPESVGEGPAYDRFRAQPDHRGTGPADADAAGPRRR